MMKIRGSKATLATQSIDKRYLVHYQPIGTDEFILSIEQLSLFYPHV